MDCSPPGSSVHGILQVGILDWVAMALLQGNFLTQGLTLGLMSSALAGVFFTTSATWELWYWPKKKKILIFLTFYFSRNGYRKPDMAVNIFSSFNYLRFYFVFF